VHNSETTRSIGDVAFAVGWNVGVLVCRLLPLRSNGQPWKIQTLPPERYGLRVDALHPTCSIHCIPSALWPLTSHLPSLPSVYKLAS
jgi:hypothetical protein